MSPIELLRFNWRPNVLRLGLAALADAGPVARLTWVVRTGLPENHFAEALSAAQAGGLLVAEASQEGLRLLVQPVVFWRERPKHGAEDFSRAWRAGAVQARMGLCTEMPSLADVMAAGIDEGSTEASATQAVRPTGFPPDSGGGLPRNPGVPFNVQRSASPEKILEALNVERSEGPEIRGARGGWIEPETEREALAACRQLFSIGNPSEMTRWGGRWTNRWRSNPEGLRKVLNMVREDQANGRQPRPGSTWGRYASDLWDRFVESEVKV